MKKEQQKKDEKDKFTISVLSAKGGVGKTMLVSSLVDLFGMDGYKVNALDCDVNAPDLAVWLGGVEKWDRVLPIKIFPLPNKYKRCKKVQVICDGQILDIENEQRGEVKIKKDFSPKSRGYKLNLISGSIDENKTGSGKVVKGVIEAGSQFESQIQILDSAPGTGYPVLTPLMKSNFAVLITEPTILGFLDLKKLASIAKAHRCDYGVVVNKWDLNPEIGEEIKQWSSERFLGKVDFSSEVEQSLKNQIPPTFKQGKVCEQIKNIYRLIPRS